MTTKPASTVVREQIVSICSWLPKCLLPVILLVLSLTQAQALTTLFGSGTGNLDLESMSQIGVSSGDTVIIKTGTYGGTIKFKNLTGLTIVPATGGVTITNTVTIGADINVTFDGTVLSGVTYGFTCTGTHSVFTDSSTSPNVQNITIKGFLFDHCGSAIEGAGNYITYTGTPATTQFYNVTLDTAKVLGGSNIFDGTYDSPITYHNVTIGLTCKNIISIRDGTRNEIQVRGCSNYNFLFDNWNVSGTTDLTGGDSGILMISAGNGTVRNFIRVGGWGYISRMWNTSISTIADSYFYNIIDYSSIHYGGIDSRMDTALLAETATIPVYGGNNHILNWTCGDKYDVSNSYITPLLVLGTMVGNDGHEYTTDLENCFAYQNIIHDNNTHGSLYEDNSNPHATLNASNNVNINGGLQGTGYQGGALPAGYLLDLVSFYPSSGGSLIGVGTTLTQTATDIYGRSRPSGSYDIGAVQHDNVQPTVAITSPTSGSTYSTTGTTINLGGTASDDVGVTSVTWSNSAGGSGTASGTASWTANGIALTTGANVITVNSYDAFGNKNAGTVTLTVTVSTASVFSQNFSSSTTLSNYINLSSPTTGQFNAIQAQSCGGTWSINGSNQLQIVRIGASTNASASFNRTTDLAGPPTVLQVSFDLGVTVNQALASIMTFQVNHLHTVQYGGANGVDQFASLNVDGAGANKIKFDVGGSQSTTAYSANGTINTINWYLNKSGSTQSYHGPDGSSQSLNNASTSLWVGNTKLFDNSAATNGSTSTMGDFIGYFTKTDTATYLIDNIVINSALP